MRISRTTGALSGLLILILGLWGGLVPFIGPYFHYSFGSNAAWHYSASRLWLDILPGAGAVLGGLMLMYSGTRGRGILGGWLSVAAGAWFVIGLSVSLLWHGAGDPIGAPMYGHVRQMVELLGYFYGIGALIVALAAVATGRFMSRPPLVADEPVVMDSYATQPTAPVAQPAAASGQTVPVAAQTVPVATAPVDATAPAGTAPVAAAPADSTSPVYNRAPLRSRLRSRSSRRRAQETAASEDRAARS